MNTIEHEVDDHTFPQQCRICGGRIDHREGWVFAESEEDAEYDHATCVPAAALTHYPASV